MTKQWISGVLRRQPIRVRLMALFTVTSTCALLLACLAFWSYETALYLQTLRRESVTIAQMMADSSAAALTFHDAEAARETANTLRAEPRVAQACFYGQDGTVMASYRRDGERALCPPSSSGKRVHYSRQYLWVFYPVAVNGEMVGALFLKIGLAELYTRSLRYGFISAIVLCLASLFALLLSARLQRMISDPILHLTRVAGEVSGSGSYDVRAVKTFEDETGILIDQFNAMMETINERDLQLKRAQDELEMRVEERTRSLQIEIAERKSIEHSLVNAKLAAEEANAAKSAFLANMSHELRTPLNAILGYSEMLGEDAELLGLTECRKDLLRIQSAGHHLLALVNDVLDISKIEAGALEVRLEAVEAGELTDGVVATIEPLARRNDNQLIVQAGEDGAMVRVDLVKFRQSLLNLLSNACKFTEHGVISLSVERCREADREFICWRVRDNGIGISADDMKRLFRPFSQVDASVTRRHGGTGLGLAISQRLCRLMGGDITAESTPGRGSTFTIFMPAEPAPAAVSSHPATMQPVETSAF
jgi:signal transduction histidine kinase